MAFYSAIFPFTALATDFFHDKWGMPLASAAGHGFISGVFYNFTHMFSTAQGTTSIIIAASMVLAPFAGNWDLLLSLNGPVDEPAFRSELAQARRQHVGDEDVQPARVTRVDLGDDADDLGGADVEADDEVLGISWLTHVAVHSCFTRFERGCAVRHAHSEAVWIAQIDRKGRNGGRGFGVRCPCAGGVAACHGLRGKQARIQAD